MSGPHYTDDLVTLWHGRGRTDVLPSLLRGGDVPPARPTDTLGNRLSIPGMYRDSGW